MAYAEVIGDPIAQSKSPIIHKYWLTRLGLEGEYSRTQVPKGSLASFLAARRNDRAWRGCNVTIPHKEAIIPLLDRLDSTARAIGAVNCVVPEHGVLSGYNSDIDGVAAALNSTELAGRKAVLIGGGGGARAVLAYLATRNIGQISIIVRSPERTAVLQELVADVDLSILPFDSADTALRDAAAIINASPLGMSGADAMPQSVLEAVRREASGSTIFDLVTTPIETEFLSVGRTGGGHAVDGLTMLVGQAERAFTLFFGAAPPLPDAELRHLLITDRRDSA